MEPSDALNPVRMENRLTKIEQAILRLVEQVGNMAVQQHEANARMSSNETTLRIEGEERRRDTMAMTDKLDGITDGIAERIKMEAAEKLGFAAGQQSVTVRMPWKQFGAGLVALTAILGGLEAVARLWL